jgi:hypothetical protein
VRQIRGPLLSAIVDLEFTSVVARKVRTRELTTRDAHDALRDFNADKKAGRYRMADVLATHYTQACEWIALLEVPLRTLDALHLAVAHGHSVPLLTADRQLARAARKLGVRARLVS